MKFSKKGEFAKDNKGEPVLVNEKREAFKVDSAIIAVWSKCLGKDEKEISREIADTAHADEKEIAPVVKEIIGKLKTAELVEAAG